MTHHRLLSALTTFGLAACSAQTPEADNSATATPGTQVGVTPTEASAEDTGPAVQPMAAQIVIQSQPGPDGSQVDLLKVAVTGDILTVTMRCSSEERINTASFRIEDQCHRRCDIAASGCAARQRRQRAGVEVAQVRLHVRQLRAEAGRDLGQVSSAARHQQDGVDQLPQSRSVRRHPITR